MAKSKARQRRVFAAVLLFCSLAATLVTVFGAEMVFRGIVLATAGRPVEAEVTSSPTVRRGRRSANSPNVLKYRFRVDGSDGWYTHTDLLTHSESRVGVSQPVWQKALETGTIGVTYYPAYPAINRPIDHTPLDGLVCPSLMTLFVGLLAFCSWVGLIDEYKKLRKESRQLSAEAGGEVGTPK